MGSTFDRKIRYTPNSGEDKVQSAATNSFSYPGKMLSIVHPNLFREKLKIRLLP